MLKEIKKYSYRILHPKLTVLITTRDDNGVPNVCAVAWIIPVSIEPPLLAVALQKKHKTTNNILETKEFVVNIPVNEQIDIVKECGSKSGWDIDKFKSLNIEKEKSRKILTPRVKGCAGYIECRLYSYFDAGDHYLFIGRILLSEVEDKMFDEMWIEPPIPYHFGKDVFGNVRRLK